LRPNPLHLLIGIPGAAVGAIFGALFWLVVYGKRPNKTVETDAQKAMRAVHCKRYAS
jgi:hypothetical protein